MGNWSGLNGDPLRPTPIRGWFSSELIRFGFPVLPRISLLIYYSVKFFIQSRSRLVIACSAWCSEGQVFDSHSRLYIFLILQKKEILTLKKPTHTSHAVVWHHKPQTRRQPGHFWVRVKPIRGAYRCKPSRTRHDPFLSLVTRSSRAQSGHRLHTVICSLRAS